MPTTQPFRMDRRHGQSSAAPSKASVLPICNYLFVGFSLSFVMALFSSVLALSRFSRSVGAMLYLLEFETRIHSLSEARCKLLASSASCLFAAIVLLQRQNPAARIPVPCECAREPNPCERSPGTRTSVPRNRPSPPCRPSSRTQMFHFGEVDGGRRYSVPGRRPVSVSPARRSFLFAASPRCGAGPILQGAPAATPTASLRPAARR